MIARPWLLAKRRFSSGHFLICDPAASHLAPVPWCLLRGG